MKIDVKDLEARVFQCASHLLGASNEPRIEFESCDWTEERAFPGNALAHEIFFGHGCRLLRIQDHAASGSSLNVTVRKGFANIVAEKAARHGSGSAIHAASA